MGFTNSFEILLRSFSPVFTEPSFKTFRLLMTGWILSTRHRYVTDLIVSSDSTTNGHFSDYHRFFSQAVWDIDHLWKLLAEWIVSTLVGSVHAKAALYAPAPKETKVRRGPRRKKGDRLKSIEAWTQDSSRWQTHHFDQYGLHGSLQPALFTVKFVN